MRNDLSRALRSIMRAPAFTLATVAIVAMGIGATTAMFALVRSILLDDLPYPAADRLVSLGSRLPNDKVFTGRRLGLSQAQYFFLGRRTHTLSDFGAYESRAQTVAITGDGPAERVQSAYATASLFTVLGLRAELGRTIIGDDDVPGSRGSVVVLGYDLWARRYGGNPQIVGTSITVDGTRVPVIGVLKRGMQLPGRKVDLWFPLGANPAAAAQNNHSLSGVAHMKPGVPFEAVLRDVADVSKQLPNAFPNVYASAVMRQGGFTTDVIYLKDEVIGATGRALWILLTAVGLVLVIAYVNAANLFIARAHARKRESAIRAALGAGYVDLVRQYLFESFTISGLAGVVGLAAAFLVVRAFVNNTPLEIPRLDEVRLAGTDVLFAFVATLAAGLLFGLIQLFGATTSSTTLREEGRGTTQSRRSRAVQRIFVIGQVAMALVLLATCGVMVRTVHDLQSIRTGFSGTGVLSVEVSLPRARLGSAESASGTWKDMVDRISALPGVTQVAATQHAPLDGAYGCSAVFVEGQTSSSPSDEPPCVYAVSVTPGYFAALQIPVRGNSLTWPDNDAGAGGVVVSRTLAERFWPHENPIGKGIRANGGAPPYYRVIGVADDVHANGLESAPVDAVYFPLVPVPGAPLPETPSVMTLLVRAQSVDVTGLAQSVRRAVAEVDPDAPITRVRTMDAIVARATGRVRFITSILIGAALMALMLSCVGLYSVIAYITRQRRGEIAIRMALGARPSQILRSVIAQSVALAILGIVFGLLGTIGVTSAVRALIPDVEANAPMVLVAASALLLVAAALAGYLPARDAARLPPTEALR
jgi:putative ABC transport system permease protein